MTDFEQALRAAEQHLRKRDARLSQAIKHIGHCTLQPTGSRKLFEDLVSAIIGQQLSGKAAQSIWNKVIGLYGGKLPKPEAIAATPDEALRSAGVSPQKLRYIRDLCAHVMDGRLKLSAVAKLDDVALTRELVAVKGIGEWTAHMVLMFTLGRLDVLPTGDLGVQKGIQKLYGLRSLPDKKRIYTIADNNGWAPYRSVASWYMWRVLDMADSH